MTRTFIDANVLIWAARGDHSLSDIAIGCLDDPSREYIASDILRLEVLPKAIYNKKDDEADFYRSYFDSVITMIETDSQLISEAESDASLNGLSAIDALHIAAARRAGAVEFITGEKDTKPLFRISDLQVTSVRPSDD